MLDVWENLKNSWQSYGMDTISIALYWIAMAWFILYQKNREKNDLYLYAIVISIFVSVMQMVLFIRQRAPMDKLFYLVPTVLIIAYAMVALTDHVYAIKKKWIIIVLYAIIIQSGTGWRFTTDYVSNYNGMKISSTVIQMAQYIENEEIIQNPFLLAPKEIATQIQEYDVNIRVAYGEGYQYTENNRQQLLLEMETYGCNFIVIKHIYDDEDEMKKFGYQQVCIIDGYSLYYKI